MAEVKQQKIDVLVVNRRLAPMLARVLTGHQVDFSVKHAISGMATFRSKQEGQLLSCLAEAKAAQEEIE